MSLREYTLWGLVGLVTGVILWVAIPEAAESLGGRWLRGRLADSDVEWQRIEWTWTGRASLHDVSFDASRSVSDWRLDAETNADRVTVGVPWSVVWSGMTRRLGLADAVAANRRFSSLRVEGAVVRIAAETVPDKPKGEQGGISNNDPQAGADPPQTDGKPDVGSTLRQVSKIYGTVRRKFPAIDEFELADGGFVISVNGHSRATGSGNFSISTQQGTVSGGGEWSVSPNVQAESDANPSALRGTWSVSGGRDNGSSWNGVLSGGVTSGSRRLGSSGLEFDELSWQIDARKPCQPTDLQVAAVNLRVKDFWDIGLGAQRAGATLSLAADDCSQPNASGHPVGLELFGVKPWLSLGEHPVESDDSNSDTNDERTAGPSLVREVASRLLPELRPILEVDITGGTVSSAWSPRPVLKELDVVWRPRGSSFSATTSAGRIALDAAFHDDSFFPLLGRWSIQRIDVGEIASLTPPMLRRFHLPKAASNVIDAIARRLDGRITSDGWIAAVANPLDLNASASSMAERGQPLLTGEFEAAFRDARADIPGLADSTVGPAQLTGTATIRSHTRPTRVVFSTDNADGPGASIGDARSQIPFDTKLVVEPPTGRLPPSFDFSVSVPETSCATGFESVPKGLWGPYLHAKLGGDAAPELSLEYSWGVPDSFELDVDGWPGECRVEALNGTRTAWPPIQIPIENEQGTPELQRPAPSVLRGASWLKKPFVLDVTEGVSDGADIQVGPGTAEYVSFGALPDAVPAAAYLSEEVAFWRDGVLNLHLIERAVRMNLEEKRFVYGGSTITQQLVKNLFLSRDKTLARKLREALIGWRLLDVISKQRVLELYLNCIEFGEDLYGIGPAARHYFQRSASELTLKQALFLAIIKPAPWYGERFRRRGSTPTKHWWRERMGEIMARLVIHDVISREEAEQARPYILKWDDDGNWTEIPHTDSEEPAFESTLKQADDTQTSDDPAGDRQQHQSEKNSDTGTTH